MSASAVSRVDFETVEVTVTGTYQTGEQVTVGSAEDILGTAMGPTDTVNVTGASPPGPVAGVFAAEITLDGKTLWSSQNKISKQNLSFDVSDYTGIHNLKFKIKRTS